MIDTDRILAEKVMDWHALFEGGNYFDESGNEFPRLDWQPTQNIEQTRMCEDKLDVQQKLWYVAHLRELMRERCTKNGITNASMQNYEMVHANAEERCQALLEAV